MDCPFFFSVIIPVFNQKQYLRDCVESILNQSFLSYEIILVDDGSTDGSSSICDQFLTFKNVSVIHKPNQGQLSARLAGIAKARGEYCVFVDSDDLLQKDALKVINGYLSRKKYDCVIIGIAKVFNGKEVWNSSKDVKEMRYLEKGRELYRTLFLNGHFNSMCRKIVKTQILNQICYENKEWLDIKHGEDLLQTIPIVDRCAGILFVPDVLYLYRQTAGSISHKRELENYQLSLDLQRHLLSFLKESNLFLEMDFNDFAKRCYEEIYSYCLKILKYQPFGSKRKKIGIIRDSVLYRDFLKQYSPRFDTVREGLIIFMFKHKLI